MSTLTPDQELKDVSELTAEVNTTEGAETAPTEAPNVTPTEGAEAVAPTEGAVIDAAEGGDDGDGDEDDDEDE